MESTQPTLIMEDSRESLRTWINRPYISDELRQQLSKANVLVVPSEGYVDRADLIYFPVGTEELFHALLESDQENLSVDICIEDEDYKELAVHADWITIGAIVAELLVVPLIVELIAEYIKRRVRKPETETQVRSKLTVCDEKTGRSVHFSYEGPVSQYRDVMLHAIQELGRQQRLTPPKPSKPKG